MSLSLCLLAVKPHEDIWISIIAPKGIQPLVLLSPPSHRLHAVSASCSMCYCLSSLCSVLGCPILLPGLHAWTEVVRLMSSLSG